jgi:hypothetical protein
LLRGDLSEVLDKCSYEWASLPPGRYGQPTLDAKRVYATFDKWLAPSKPIPVSPAPVPEKPMAPFIAAALPSILAAVPDLLKIFKDRGKESTEQYAQAAEKVVQIAIQATNATNVQDAVEKIAGDPGAAEAVREAVKTRWYELVSSSEESIASARTFAVQYSQDRTVLGKLTFIEMLSLVFVAVSSMGGGWVLIGEFPPEMKGAVITLMLIAGFTGVKEFWFGSSRGSDRKTEMLNER